MPSNLIKEFFLHNGREIAYGNGDIIFRADDIPSGIYLILSGAVKSFYYTDHGDLNVHTIWGHDSIFPFDWILVDASVVVSYEALGDAVLLRVDKKVFDDALSNDVAFASALARHVVTHSMNYEYRVRNLQYQNAHERFVYQLLLLTRRFGTPNGKGFDINLPLTHALMAGLISVSRETVSRIMRRLQRDDLIRQDGKQLTVVDTRELFKQIKNGSMVEELFEFDKPASSYWRTL